MEVRVAVAVVLQNQLCADPHAETVEGICADLTGLVGTLHHAVRLVIEVGRNGDVFGADGCGRANLFFLYQIAALIVSIAVVIDTSNLLLIAAGMLAQRVIAVGIGKRIVGVDFQFAGAAGEPVQGIVGICCAALEIFRGIAVPLELRQLVFSSFICI